MASSCTRQPQLSLVHCILCRWTWNTTYYIYHDFGFLCFPGMRLWALNKTAVCWMYSPGIKPNILAIKAMSNCVMADKSSSRFLPKLNSCSSWETANRKPQFTVTRCSFTMPGFQILAKYSLFSVAMLFSSSRSASLLSHKNRNNSLSEFKTPTNTSYTDKESYFVPLRVRLYSF